MSHPPLSPMNRLNQAEPVVFQIMDGVFPKHLLSDYLKFPCLFRGFGSSIWYVFMPKEV